MITRSERQNRLFYLLKKSKHIYHEKDTLLLKGFKNIFKNMIQEMSLT